MPVLQRDDATIHYEEHGTGFPVLALAPGGVRSAGDNWSKAPWSPVAELAGDYRVITMDQRNAGASRAPVTGAEGWATYTDDQLALLDHLDIQRCHVVGMCSSAVFVLRLLHAEPQRFARAVALQPIGRADNRESFHEMFDDWAEDLRAGHPETSEREWAAYRAALYDGPDTLFGIADSALATITTPLLVLRGDDHYHPVAASELVAATVPGARLIERWKDPDHLPAATSAIAEFLAAG